MRKKFKLSLTLFALMCLICNSSIFAQERDYTFGVVLDQDFLLLGPLNNEDRNYTQGTSFSYSSKKLYQNYLFKPFKKINDIGINNGRKIKPVASSVSIMGTAFTPRDIDSLNPIVGDRPFSFLFAMSLNQINEIGEEKNDRKKFESITLNIGVLGTDIGYKFQSFAHTHIIPGRAKDPIGWNTQISKGGRLTMLLNYERLNTYKIIKSKTKSVGFGWDGYYNIGASAGYYDRVYTGLYTRIGWLNDENLSDWAFFGNAISTASMLKAKRGINDGKCKFECKELFIFASATYNRMIRNAMLVGQTNNSNTEYVLNYDWVNPNLFEYSFGAALGIYWRRNKNPEFGKGLLRLLYKVNLRSPEFDSKILPERWHYYGTLGIQVCI